MGKHWKEVKQAIDKEIETIWFAEPIEVKASKAGVFPSGAGAHGTCIGNRLYQISMTQALGCGPARSGMENALRDDSLSLDACKALFTYLNHDYAFYLGAKEEYTGAAWLNLPKVWAFYSGITDSFWSVMTKDELAILTESWQLYLSRLYDWFRLSFPLDALGVKSPSRKVEDVKALFDLTVATEEYMHISRQEVD